MYKSQELEDHYIMDAMSTLVDLSDGTSKLLCVLLCFLASSKKLYLKTEAEDPKSQETSLDKSFLPTVNLGIV